MPRSGRELAATFWLPLLGSLPLSAGSPSRAGERCNNSHTLLKRSPNTPLVREGSAASRGGGTVEEGREHGSFGPVPDGPRWPSRSLPLSDLQATPWGRHPRGTAASELPPPTGLLPWGPSPRHFSLDSLPPKSSGELTATSCPTHCHQKVAASRRREEKWRSAHRHFLAATFW